MLDVAIGNDNASLAAARRWCDMVATDTGLPAGKRSSRALSEGRVFKAESPSTCNNIHEYVIGLIIINNI